MKVKVLVTQSCPALCVSMNCSPPGSSPFMGFPRQEVGCRFLLQRIFLTQGLNQGFLHCHLSHQRLKYYESENSESQLHSCVWLFAILWTAACPVPLPILYYCANTTLTFSIVDSLTDGKTTVNQENLSLPSAVQNTINLTECHGESEGNVSNTHYRVQV